MNLRKEAKGRMCTVQIFGVCNKDPETSVLAHLNVPGLNTKAHDLHGCIACSSCHAWLDYDYARYYRTKDGILGIYTVQERDLEHLKAVIKTQKIWIEEGFI